MKTNDSRWTKAWNDFAIWRRLTWDLSGRSPEKVSGNSYARMLGFMSPFWWLLVLILALSFTSIALGVVPVFIVKNIINKTLPPHANLPLLWHFVELLAGIFLVKTLMGALSSYLHGILSNGIIQDLRSDLFSRLIKQPPKAESRERTTTRVINDVGISSTGFSVLGWRPEAMSGVVGFLNMVLGFINNGWSLFVSLTAMFILSWHFTLVLLLALPPFFLLTRLVARVLYTLSHQEYGNMAELNASMVRSVGWAGSAWARLFGQESKQRQEFEEANRKISETSIASRIISDAHHMSYTFPIALTTVFIWFYGAIQVMHGTMSLGTLIAFSALLVKNTWTLSNFIGAFVFFPHLRGVLDRIFAMWPSTEGIHVAFLRRRHNPGPRPSLWHWLRDLEVRFTPPPVMRTKSLRRLLAFMLPYWPYWLMILADAVIAVAGLATLVPLFQRTIIDTAIPQHNLKLLAFAVFMIGLFPFVHLFSAELSATGHEFLSHRSLQRMRNWAYDRMQQLSPAAMKDTTAGTVMARLLNDINALYSAYGELSDLTWMFLPIIPSIIFMIILSWRLGVLIGLITLVFIPLLKYGGKLFYGINRTIFEQVEDLSTFVLDSLEPTTLATIQQQDKIAEVETSFNKKNQRLADLGLTSTVMHGWFGDVFGLHYSLITILLWMVGGVMIIHGQLLLGTLVAVMAYAGKIEGFGGGFGVYLVVRTMQANADRVFSLVDSFPVPEGTGSLPGLAPSLAPGLALTVEGLRVTDLSPNFEWIQPEHTVYGIHGGNEGEQILEALAGLRDPFQGRIEHSGERIALISGESPLPPISPQDMLSAAYGSIMTPDAVEDILIRVGLRNLDPERPLPEGVDDDQRRRLALAQAIVKPPALVLADCSTLDGHPLREFFPASTLVTLWRPQDSEARTNVDHVVTPQPRGA